MAAYRSNRNAARPGRQAGFTLVELLVAMTLLAFLSIMLFGGLRFGARSWEVVVRSSAERDQVVAVQTFLRDRISEMTLPGNAKRRPDDKDGSLTGDAGRVEFIAPWLSALSLGGLYQFTLWHEDTGDDTDGGQVLLGWRPEGADPAGLEELGDLAGQRVLLDGVTEFSVSYYGAVDQDEASEWRDQWEEQETPPRLVRVQLAFADARRQWPDFVVAPKF
jgi:general secretion pathway protein J